MLYNSIDIACLPAEVEGSLPIRGLFGSGEKKYFRGVYDKTLLQCGIIKKLIDYNIQ